MPRLSKIDAGRYIWTAPDEDAVLWSRFADALVEGRVSVILENAVDTIDGGEITTQLDEVVGHILEVTKNV